MKRKNLKGQRGIVVSDAILAILIILLFTGIIISLITNIVMESTKIKMNSQQLDFAVELLEHIETMPYENVTEDNLIKYVNDKNAEYVSAGTTVDTLTTPYKIGIKVEKYNETEGNTDKLDIIKIVTLTIENSIEDKQYSTTISRIKKASIDEIKTMLE